MPVVRKRHRLGCKRTHLARIVETLSDRGIRQHVLPGGQLRKHGERVLSPWRRVSHSSAGATDPCQAVAWSRRIRSLRAKASGASVAVETRGSNGGPVRFGVVGRTVVPADRNEDAFENAVAARLLSMEGLHVVAGAAPGDGGDGGIRGVGCRHDRVLLWGWQKVREAAGGLAGGMIPKSMERPPGGPYRRFREGCGEHTVQIGVGEPLGRREGAGRRKRSADEPDAPGGVREECFFCLASPLSAKIGGRQGC